MKNPQMLVRVICWSNPQVITMISASKPHNCYIYIYYIPIYYRYIPFSPHSRPNPFFLENKKNVPQLFWVNDHISLTWKLAHLGMIPLYIHHDSRVRSQREVTIICWIFSKKKTKIWGYPHDCGKLQKYCSLSPTGLPPTNHHGATCCGGCIKGVRGSSPRKAFSKEDFPEPTGPSTATSSPTPTLKGSDKCREGALLLVPMWYLPQLIWMIFSKKWGIGSGRIKKKKTIAQSVSSHKYSQ